MTAPDKMCAPTSEPFSSTTTEISLPACAASCFRRMAAASPAGPAPTIDHVEFHRLARGKLGSLLVHDGFVSLAHRWACSSHAQVPGAGSKIWC